MEQSVMVKESGKQEQNSCSQWAESNDYCTQISFVFYSAQDFSPWMVQLRDGYLYSIIPFWKLFATHIQKCVAMVILNPS